MKVYVVETPETPEFSYKEFVKGNYNVYIYDDNETDVPKTLLMKTNVIVTYIEPEKLREWLKNTV